MLQMTPDGLLSGGEDGRAVSDDTATSMNAVRRSQARERGGLAERGARKRRGLVVFNGGGHDLESVRQRREGSRREDSEKGARKRGREACLCDSVSQVKS